MKSILLGSTAALLISTSVFAADAVSEPPPAPPVAMADPVQPFSWSGAYIGIHGGYGWGDGDLASGGASTSSSFDGGRFGGFTGYNWQFQNGLVAGVEGNLDYDWNDEDFAPGFSGESGTNGAVRARVGYGMDRVLLYAAGGWTATNFEVNTPAGSSDKTLNGWTIGAGFDYAVTDNVFGRVEYRYNDYGDRDIGGTNVDFSQNVVNVGLGVKF